MALQELPSGSREWCPRFLKALENYPPIWNTECHSFQNKGIKAEAWRNLAREMGATEETVKLKYRSIRTQYTKQSRLIRDGHKKGIEVKKWWMYDLCSIFDPTPSHGCSSWSPSELNSDSPSSIISSLSPTPISILIAPHSPISQAQHCPNGDPQEQNVLECETVCAVNQIDAEGNQRNADVNQIDAEGNQRNADVNQIDAEGNQRNAADEMVQSIQHAESNSVSAPPKPATTALPRTSFSGSQSRSRKTSLKRRHVTGVTHRTEEMGNARAGRQHIENLRRLDHAFDTAAQPKLHHKQQLAAQEAKYLAGLITPYFLTMKQETRTDCICNFLQEAKILAARDAAEGQQGGAGE